MGICIRCQGNGRYIGIGFMMRDCELCNVDEVCEAPPLTTLNRKSASYKKAIKDIMEINPEITRKDAVKMFDEAYEK